MKKIIQLFICIAVIIAMLAGIQGCAAPTEEPVYPDPEDETLENSSQMEENILVYSGAGLRNPVEEIARLYEEKQGIQVNLFYGGSAYCVSQILLTEKGEAFLPGDLEEVFPLREKDMVKTEIPLVYHIPVLAVPESNPADIQSLQDLKKPGVRVGLGDSEANPIGKLSDKILKDLGYFEEVEPNIVVRCATVNEMFAYLALEQIDAAIIWEDNLVGHDKIGLVNVPELNDYIKIIPVVSLTCAEHPDIAEDFINFVSGEEAMDIWMKWEFRPVIGGLE